MAKEVLGRDEVPDVTNGDDCCDSSDKRFCESSVGPRRTGSRNEGEKGIYMSKRRREVVDSSRGSKRDICGAIKTRVQ